jgi:hypothetical protein
MAGHNEDGGYDHFHHMGRKSPHQGKLVEPVGFKKAPDSGPGGMGKTGEGKDPGVKPMNIQRKVPGSGGPGGIVGP